MVDLANDHVNSLAKYDCLDVLHHNIFSTIYRARHKVENKLYIIKVLNDTYLKPDDSMYFNYEYNIAKKIHKTEGVIHPLKIEMSPQDGTLIVYDNFNAELLSELLKKKTFSIEQSLRLCINLTLAIKQIHHSKITHREISPYSILYDPDSEKICIIEFGVSIYKGQKNLDFNEFNNIRYTHSLSYTSPEQVGRVLYTSDYRSDLYSLGAVFYKVLTGREPFGFTDDSRDLLISQLSHSPTPPVEINSRIDKNLSDLVLKLINKHPEKRYRCAEGVLEDLNWCYERTINSNVDSMKISENKLILGKKDFSEYLSIPNYVYGREHEMRILDIDFKKICQGESRCLWLHGDPGIGKTSLIRSLYQSLTLKRGLFFSGKFDAFQQDTPLSGVIQALNKFVSFILSEPEVSKKYWVYRLQTAIGDGGQLMFNILPKLKLLLPPQPELIETTTSENTKNRFYYIFKKFIKSIGSKDHPFVLFLDDLQWIDQETMFFLKSLLEDKDIEYFLFLGAYRDNEVNAHHPLSFFLKEQKLYNKNFNTLFVKGLTVEYIHDLTFESLQPSTQNFDSLVQWLHESTSGNPYFIRELIKHLEKEKIIFFKHQSDTSAWFYDENKLKYINVSSITSLTSLDIRRLLLPQKELLIYAAFLGFTFNLADLSLIACRQLSDVVDDLENLYFKGFIEPLGGAYKLVISNYHDGIDYTSFQYRFSHDYIRQAAYDAQAESKISETHLMIAKVLHEQYINKNDESKSIFQIAYHYQVALSSIKDQSTKCSAYDVFVIAAQRLQTLGAFYAAYTYFNNALSILDINSCWKTDYQKTLQLYSNLCTSALAIGKVDDLKFFSEKIISNVSSYLDAFSAHENSIQSLVSRGMNEEAISYLIDKINLYGITLSHKPSVLKSVYHLFSIRTLLRPSALKKIRALPIVNIEDKSGKLQKLMHLYLYISIRTNKPNHVLQACYTSISIFFKQGIRIETSIVAIQVVSIIFISRFWNIKYAIYLSSFIDELVQRVESKNLPVTYLAAKSGLIELWWKTFQETSDDLKKAYISGLNRGEIIAANDSLTLYISSLYFTRTRLSDALIEASSLHDSVKNLSAENYHVNSYYCQIFYNLSQATPGKPWEFNGPYATDDVPAVIKNSKYMYAGYWVKKIELAYLFYHYDKAEEFIAEYNALNEKGGPMIKNDLPTILTCLKALYIGLTIFELQQKRREKNPRYTLSEISTQSIRHALKIFKQTSTHCPENTRVFYLLLQAKQAEVNFHNKRAECLFLEAIQASNSNTCGLGKALSRELLGRYYLKEKKEQYRALLKEAVFYYEKWGVFTKSKHIKEFYQV